MYVYRIKIYEPIFLCHGVFACVFQVQKNWYSITRKPSARFRARIGRQRFLSAQAIAADPTPESHKRYGGRTVAYYPYFELGLAIWRPGISERRINLQQIRQYGAAPQDQVEKKCLKIVTTILEKSATSAAVAAAS